MKGTRNGTNYLKLCNIIKMNNNNNNQQRPTCKVVTRPNGGGARIHPRGCKVRSRVQADNSVRKEAKATGLIKPVKRTFIEVGDNHYLMMRAPNGRTNRMMWDTGATYTSISTATAKRLGLLTPRTNQVAAGFTAGPGDYTTIADGTLLRVRSVLNVPLRVQRTGELVHGRVNIMPGNATSLLGNSHIRQIKTMKIKFR